MLQLVWRAWLADMFFPLAVPLYLTNFRSQGALAVHDG